MDRVNPGSRLSVENPFQNEEILEKVAKHCEFQSLKSFRLVNKMCYKESLARWRNVAVLSVAHGKRSRSYAILLTELEERFQDPSEDFLKLVSVPFSRYKFLGWWIDGQTCGASALFWKTVGPNLKYLEVSKCCFISGRSKYVGNYMNAIVRRFHSLEKIMFPCADGGNVAPNLEELVLTNNSFQYSYHTSPRSELHDAPNTMKNLTLKRFDITHGIGYMFPIEMDTLLQRLPNLERIGGFPASHASLGNLPVKRVNLDLDRYPLHEDTRRNVNFLNKLESVVVSRYKTPRMRLPLAELSRLRHFHIWGPFTVSNFNFLQFTPDLQVLKINLVCFEKRSNRTIRGFLRRDYFPSLNMVELSSREEMRCLQLVGLVHLEIDFQFAPEDLLVLKNWMPNLTTLKTILDNPTFRVVCHEWSNSLRELVLLYGSDVNDEAIVGNSVSSLENDDKKERIPNITNLTDLRRFELHAYCNQSKLGDASVNFGFLQMSRLTDLRICVSDQMSEDAIQRLKKKLQFVQVIRNDGPGPHAGYDCCARLDFYSRAIEGVSYVVEFQPVAKRLRSQTE